MALLSRYEKEGVLAASGGGAAVWGLRFGGGIMREVREAGRESGGGVGVEIREGGGGVVVVVVGVSWRMR